MEHKNRSLRKTVICSIMSALSFVLMMLEFPIAFLIPGFIKFDFSELPALITSFAIGPFYGVLVCLVKNLLHLPLSQTSGVGELANFLIGSVFCFCSGFIYKKGKTKKYALLGCLLGSVAMAILSFPINYYITYPFYYNFMSKDLIINAYSSILPVVNSIPKALLIFNLPFTFFKGIIDSVICVAVYKKISGLIKGEGKTKL